jgi:hypothetical protein
MFLITIFTDYIRWHYGQALHEYIRIIRTGRDFIIYFFSVPLLLKTLFSPFKRIEEKPMRGFNIEDWVGRIIINVISRVIGFFIRATLIFSGILIFFIFMIISIFGFAFWLASPFIILLTTLSGAVLIIISTI